MSSFSNSGLISRSGRKVTSKHCNDDSDDDDDSDDSKDEEYIYSQMSGNNLTAFTIKHYISHKKETIDVSQKEISLPCLSKMDIFK